MGPLGIVDTNLFAKASYLWVKPSKHFIRHNVPAKMIFRLLRNYFRIIYKPNSGIQTMIFKGLNCAANVLAIKSEKLSQQCFVFKGKVVEKIFSTKSKTY